MMRVFLNHAKVLKLDQPVSKVIVGNADVADATVADSRTIVLTGKAFGTTNLVLLDADGNASLRLNCNRARGTWSAQAAGDGQSGAFTFGPLAMTRALCPPPSMDEDIARQLASARIADAVSSGAGTLVTDDPACLAHLGAHAEPRVAVAGFYGQLAQCV